jgi:acetylornithine deacetylase/succinyl-diaminopimelate desuccinylase-like protein
MHVKAVEVLLNTTGLPCNVKFFIEGEEEVGSENLEGVLRTNADKLKADVLLISDTSMIANDVPSIAVGLRGLSYVEVKVVGPNRDLHSGTYGGAVENPLNVLCKMVAQLKDANNRITIPGFYEKVDELSLEQRAELESAPFDEAVYRKELDLAATDGEAGYTTRERATIRPTLDLNGIWGGYTGAGAKTVLPSMAQAKISMRLVPNQDPDEITELFTKHFLSLAPATVKVSVSPHHGGRPFLTSTDSPAYRAAEAAMTETFGKKPIPTREGGSIPILALFQEVLQTPIILMGFGLDTDALHSPNEHYGLFNYFKGIETLAVYHHKYKEVTEKELA